MKKKPAIAVELEPEEEKSSGRKPRKGPVSKSDVPPLITELRELVSEAETIRIMFDAIHADELQVDGIGLAKRGMVHVGAFLGNLAKAVKKERRLSGSSKR